MMLRVLSTTLVLTFAVVRPCFADELAKGAAPSDKVRQHLGKAAVDVLLRAEKAEAFLVGDIKMEKAGADGTVGGRLLLGKAIPMKNDVAVRLAQALLADDTYFRGDSKGTGKAAVGFRLWTSRKERFEFSCCLARGNVWIAVKDADGKVIAQGDRRGFRDDRASPLRTIAAELFPENEEVQMQRPKTPPDSKPAGATPKADSGPFEPGAKVIKLADGFKFTEGPTSDVAGNVYFTDQPNDRILKWSVDGKLSTFLEKSGRSNGLCFDADGKLWACADENNELWKIDVATKTHTSVVKDFQGKKLNAPNDVWVRPDGGAYFTDPYYKRSYWTRGPEEQDKRGVYYVSPKGEVKRVDGDYVQPNGIVGTPDGKVLYVADIKAKRTYAYDIGADGSLAGRRLFCSMGSDGMTLDAEGNVYLTGADVAVFNKAGKKIANLAVPEQPANVCFGGKDQKTLFITARQGLYAIQMRVAGASRQ